MILLSTYMMAIWANCQWIFFRLRPYKNLVNEPLWPYRIAVNSLFCLMAIAYNCQQCDYQPQLCRNSVNEWLTAIREYIVNVFQQFKAIPDSCQLISWKRQHQNFVNEIIWVYSAIVNAFWHFFIISIICHKVQGLIRGLSKRPYLTIVNLFLGEI